MIAPPVPPKSHQTKFAGIKAIFEQNASHSQVNDSNTVSSNFGKTFSPTMRKLMEDSDINIHVSASTLSKQRPTRGIVVYLHAVMLVVTLLMVKIE